MAGADYRRLFDDFKVFVARVQGSPQIAPAVAASFTPEPDARRLVATYAGEAEAALALIAPLLRPGARVLEVGSGICLLTCFLGEQGVDIMGIEPGASGFGFMPQIGAAVLGQQGADVQVLRIGAEGLDPAIHGRFDLIFSANVLEHIADLDGAFGGMSRVLAPGGQMIHQCPNYFLPYEPHFGIPLVPVFPRLTRLLYPAVLTRFPGLWQDLNFITASQVRRLSRRFGLTVTFERGVLTKILARLNDDAVFRDRQGGLARLVSKLIAALGVTSWVEAVPGDWLSPMVMRFSHAEGDAKP